MFKKIKRNTTLRKLLNKTIRGSKRIGIIKQYIRVIKALVKYSLKLEKEIKFRNEYEKEL